MSSRSNVSASSASDTLPQDTYSITLKEWVNTQLELLEGHKWQPLKGDAGFRQYFRVIAAPSDVSRIAVLAPPATEDSKAFIDIAEHLRGFGVKAPEVYAVDLENGFLLLEDLGRSTYFEHLTAESVSQLYDRALNCLLDIQKAIPGQMYLTYDDDKLLSEMRLFLEWFIPQLLGYTVSAEEREMIEGAFQVLLSEIQEQPKCIVHRDFHSQNIMFGDDGQPGVVDFQDAVVGPVTYDLVSLLRDCYIAWNPAQVNEWALAYAKKLQSSEVINEVGNELFIRWFDWMGLQRHIKVMGIFARLALRDNKHKYLNDLPLVIHYFRSVAVKYSELNDLLSWFDAHLLPLIHQQPWMGDVVIHDVAVKESGK